LDIPEATLSTDQILIIVILSAGLGLYLGDLVVSLVAAFILYVVIVENND